MAVPTMPTLLTTPPTTIAAQELCVEPFSASTSTLEIGGPLTAPPGALALVAAAPAALAAPAHRALHAALNATDGGGMASLVEGGAAAAAAVLTLHNASGLAAIAAGIASWTPLGLARSASAHVAAMAHQAHGTEPRRRHRRHRSRRLKGSHGGGGGGGEGGEGGALLWLNPAFGSFDDFATSMITLYVMSTGADPSPSPNPHPNTLT
eukprot:scaffold128579_cov30-Phaeocystis_antarctica.AAC.1